MEEILFYVACNYNPESLVELTQLLTYERINVRTVTEERCRIGDTLVGTVYVLICNGSDESYRYVLRLVGASFVWKEKQENEDQ